MLQVLRDQNGRVIGEIEEVAGIKILRDAYGRKLGEFDGQVTRDNFGRLVGYGDLLSSLVRK